MAVTVTVEVAFHPEERTTLVGFKLTERPGAGIDADKSKAPLKPPKLVKRMFSEPEDPSITPMSLPC